ncbi:MAG: ZPR1 zinc finger domain-containing protein [Candidatus Syntropharchaeia archaeon]
MEIKGICPGCGSKIDFHWIPYEIPYFDEIMIITARCTCGYSHTDTMILSQKEPTAFEVEISSEEDLSIRVVRSSTGIIRIPELGIEIEPKEGESFVSNIEGIFDRIERVVRMLTDTEKGREILERLKEVKEGKKVVTVIIEDPFGNSAIISEKARKYEYSGKDKRNRGRNQEDSI